MPLETQSKLLRVLQEHEFDRVGGTSPRKVDVRVIAATNRELKKAVHEKTFREDLYYRLSVFPIRLPPLRERSEDIPLLAQYLLNKFAAKIARRIHGIDTATLKRLMAYQWPGNVRELQNVLERALILATGPTLKVDPDVLAPPGSENTGIRSATLEDVELNHILAVLGQTNWVIDGPRRGHYPRSSPEHPPQPTEKARGVPLIPRTFVVPHDGPWRLSPGNAGLFPLARSSQKNHLPARQ